MDKPCEARAIGQEMHCARCGLRWDFDDTAPTCNPLPQYITVARKLDDPKLVRLGTLRMSKQDAEKTCAFANQWEGGWKYEPRAV